MSATGYYLAWLGIGLALIALASALIARNTQRRIVRRAMALNLLEALSRCSAWAAAQRHGMLSEPDADGGDAALQEVRAIQQRWFTALHGEAARWHEAHAQLTEFLRAQQALRWHDTEAWLLSDPDVTFMRLWRSHRDATQAFAEKLEGVAALAGGGFDPGSTLAT